MRGVTGSVGKRWTAALIAGGLIVVALGAGAFAQASGMAAGILKVRLGGDTSETRLVIDLDRSVSGKLISDGAADNTVIIAFPRVGVSGDLKGAGQGVVRRWTVNTTGGSARLNIELARKAGIRIVPPGTTGAEAGGIYLPSPDDLGQFWAWFDRRASQAPPLRRRPRARIRTP